MTNLTRRGFGRMITGLGLSAITGRAAQRPAARMWVSSVDRQLRMSEQPTVELIRREQPGTIPIISMEPDRTYQKMFGFGSSFEPATCWNLTRLDTEKRRQVVERLVSPSKGIGMNLMRICIGTPDFTGDPWYSYNDLPSGETDQELKRFSIEKDRAYILPILKLAREVNQDLLYFASPWSPPGWMKTTGSLIGGSVLPQWYPVYAEYFVRFLKAYAEAGVPIHAITVQNEPGVDRAREKDPKWHYPSCHWTGEQERDFIRDHLGPALRRHGLKTKIWCYDHNYNEKPEGDDPGIAYPRTILSDTVAARFVDGVAFHGYAGRASGMSALQKEFPRIPLHFTEGSVFGIRGGRQLIERLRNQATSYNAWVTMLDENSKPNNGPFPASRTILTLNPKTLEVTEHFDFDLYGHFMKFIARGAVRIGSSEAAGDLANVAFRNPDGRLVLVVINTGNGEREVDVVIGDSAARIRLRPASIATVIF